MLDQSNQDGKVILKDEVDEEFNGLVIEKLSEDPDKPIPYIANFTPTGLMTIKWDRLMEPYDEPAEIPLTRVIVDLDLFRSEPTRR